MSRSWRAMAPCLLTGLMLSCGAGQRGPDEDDFIGPEDGDCYDLRDNGHPWVVEVPGTSRSRLRADIEKGIVLVHYEECSGAKLLPQCVLNTQYESPVDGGRETDKILMNNRLDLF